MKKQQQDLRENVKALKREAFQNFQTICHLQINNHKVNSEKLDAERSFGEELKRRRAEIAERINERSKLLAEVRNLRKCISRADSRRELAIKKAKAFPSIFKLFQGGFYTSISRKLACKMFLSGCPCAKVGSLIRDIAEAFGIKVNRLMSRRTVSRSVLEGYVSSKVQTGHEIGFNEGDYKFLIIQNGTNG